MLKKIILPSLLILSFVAYSAHESQSKAAAAATEHSVNAGAKAAELAKNILAKQVSGTVFGMSKSPAEQRAATEALKKAFTEVLGGKTARAQSQNKDLASKLFDKALHDLQVEKLESFLSGDINKKDMLKSLLKKGINTPDDHGDTLLTHAIRQGHRGFLDAVFDLNPDVDAADKYNRTPLMIAAKGSGIYGLGRLISLNANVNAQDKDGNTALLYAIKAGNREAVKMLLEAGADVSGKAGAKLIELAEKNKDPEILKLLKDAGATWSFDAGGWPEVN
jgi:hypothetical protein